MHTHKVKRHRNSDTNIRQERTTRKLLILGIMVIKHLLVNYVHFSGLLASSDTTIERYFTIFSLDCFVRRMKIKMTSGTKRDKNRKKSFWTTLLRFNRQCFKIIRYQHSQIPKSYFNILCRLLSFIGHLNICLVFPCALCKLAY